MVTTAGRPVDRHEFWLRTVARWDLLFYVLLGVAAVGVLLTPPTTARSWGALALLAVLLAAYLLVGRRAALVGRGGLADLYLAVMVPVVAACAALDSAGFVLLFVAFSHIWFFSRNRIAGAVWSVAQAAAIIGAAWLIGGDWSGQIASLAAQMLAALAFSLALGLWITQVSEQSEQRAELLARLEATQSELAASHHAAGVVAERQRLAQEIHDTLAQGFTSVVMLAQATEAELDRGRTPEARARVTQIEQVARDNLAEARALVTAFGPAGLTDTALGEALGRLAERFTAETGVHVELVGDRAAADELPREAQVVLLRAVQEALANVRKHAAAARVTLELVRTEDDVRLQVTDDGRGLPAGTAEGNGLRGMRERVRAGGGSLRLGEGPSGGTQVELTLPARADAGAQAPQAERDA